MEAISLEVEFANGCRWQMRAFQVYPVPPDNENPTDKLGEAELEVQPK